MSYAPRPERDPRRKAMLFCPTCGHESPVDGDWRLRERAHTTEYRCPDCNERLTEREGSALALA